MASESNPETVQVVTVRRTAHLHVNCPQPGQAPEVIFERQQIRKTAEGVTLSSEVRDNVRRLVSGDVLAEQVTLQSGKTVSAAELAEAFSRFGDKWDAEDLAAREAAAQEAEEGAEGEQA